MTARQHRHNDREGETPDDQMPTNSRFVAKRYQKAKVLEALQTFEG